MIFIEIVFKVIFLQENAYFRNIVLTKDYLINFMPPEDASFLQYEGLYFVLIRLNSIHRK